MYKSVNYIFHQLPIFPNSAITLKVQDDYFSDYHIFKNLSDSLLQGIVFHFLLHFFVSFSFLDELIF
jgi:hypothetical protein